MVDLTADREEEMDEAPATHPLNVSDSEGDMDTDEEEDILAYHGLDRDGADSSDENGFQHV